MEFGKIITPSARSSSRHRASISPPIPPSTPDIKWGVRGEGKAFAQSTWGTTSAALPRLSLPVLLEEAGLVGTLRLYITPRGERPADGSCASLRKVRRNPNTWGEHPQAFFQIYRDSKRSADNKPRRGIPAPRSLIRLAIRIHRPDSRSRKESRQSFSHRGKANTPASVS